ncbi:MAG: phosphotransferase [Bifidobacteriaceae bacterium]|jgi:thiamine kinase-like enzyme|nr:phosphotransferase [Bifidobacteriaceae bacterium]
MGEKMNGSEQQSNPAREDAAREAIAELMAVDPARIESMSPLVAGMTNTSFTFRLDGGSYVVRLPGPGTESLIDRSAERDAYRALAPYDLTDEVVALDTDGRRVTVFYDDARQADPADDSDLAAAMGLIRRLHELDLPLKRRFDIDGMITQYEALCDQTSWPSYPKLAKTRRRVAELQDFKRRLAVPEIFCHGDMAPVNVLILGGGAAKLIDYEYSGRADPIMDVAMYGIFGYYDRERLELALRLYLGRAPVASELARLYLYAALGGYLWSLWAHYKGENGQDFGDYGLRMFNYMRRYHRCLVRSGLAEAVLAEKDLVEARLAGTAPAERALDDAAQTATLGAQVGAGAGLAASSMAAGR